MSNAIPVSNIKRGHIVHTFGPLKSAAEKWKPWKAPRLTERGRDFAPKVGRVGSEVIFEYNGQRLRGQVWSKGPKRGELWVVIDQQAYLVGGARR